MAVFQAAVAHVPARQVPAVADRLNSLDGADAFLGEAIQDVSSRAGGADERKFFDAKVIRSELEFHLVGLRIDPRAVTSVWPVACMHNRLTKKWGD